MAHLLTAITTNAHYANVGIKGYQVINALNDIPQTYSSELSRGKKAARIAIDLMFVCGQVAIAALPKKPLTSYLEYGVAALSIATNLTDWACQSERTSNNLLKNVGLIIFRLADITNFIKLPEGLFPTAARSLVYWGTVLTTLYAERTRIAAYLGSAKAQHELGYQYYLGEGFVENNVEARNWYRKAAQKEHLQAQIDLARLYKNGYGIGVTRNNIQAIEWYTKAANQNSPMAQIELGQLYKEIKSYNEAVTWFQKAADTDATAQCYLGEMYRDGLGVVQSDTEAFKWFKKAADNLFTTSFPLALCYYLGKGVAQDFNQAFQLLQSLKNCGMKEVHYYLALCYKNGNGVEQNLAEAVTEFRKAAERDHKEAQYELAYCYINGHGVIKDLEEGYLWLEKVANQGNVHAQAYIGNRYHREKNDVEAIKWFQKAADQQHTQAEAMLGYYYLDGIGIEKNDDLAFAWSQKAALKGDVHAQNNLGICYKQGRGVSKNLVEAANWFKKAADQGSIEAQAQLDKLNSLQTPPATT